MTICRARPSKPYGVTYALALATFGRRQGNISRLLLRLCLASAFAWGNEAVAGGATAAEGDGTAQPVACPASGLVPDPLNATYTIEGVPVRLKEGRAETPAAPNSALRVRTSVFGEPAQGSLDAGGAIGSALILVHSPGGSGTFYYVGVAGRLSDGYVGSNAVLLGDRLVVKSVSLRNGLVIVEYLERAPEAPMAAAPTIPSTMVLRYRRGRLRSLAAIGEGELLMEGHVRVGHESRTFTPCGQDTPQWILGDSPAWNEIVAVYHDTLPDAQPGAPLFMMLAGSAVTSPEEGFGSEYLVAISAVHLFAAIPGGKCPCQPESKKATSE